MKVLNIIVEGGTEENFVNEVIRPHLAILGIYVYCRKILTGWDKANQKPSKGGLLKYQKFRNDVTRWIEEGRGRENVWYTSFIDLYAFPKDDKSPYCQAIRSIADPYAKVKALEKAIGEDIDHISFIPYVQLHEFEAFLLASPESLKEMYPEQTSTINKLIKEVRGLEPEKVNETPQNAPSKRIIQYIPEYEYQKAQVGALVAEDIGLQLLREKCPHFNEWLVKIENL